MVGRVALAQGLTALWAMLPLSVQLLGSGGLEVSSLVVPSLSLLLTKAAVLQRQETILQQPLSTTRLQSFLLELLQVLLKRVSRNFYPCLFCCCFSCCCVCWCCLIVSAVDFSAFGVVAVGRGGYADGSDRAAASAAGGAAGCLQQLG